MERPARFRTYEGNETLPRVTSRYEAEPHTKGAGREQCDVCRSDVHKESISGAVLRPGAKAPEEFQLKHTVAGLRRLAKRLLSSASGPVVCAYEAGSVGYAPQRELRRLGVDCQVIAPSLVPIRPGDRLKTDRRDACKLAGLLRAGELVEVSPPSGFHAGAQRGPGLQRRRDRRGALPRPVRQPGDGVQAPAGAGGQ